MTITAITGDNGIMKQASSAADATEKAQMVERVQMAILQSFGKDGEIDKDKLIENLQKVEGIDKGSIPSDSDFDYPLTIVVGGHEITVDADGDAYIEGEEGGNTNTNPGGNTHPGGNTGGDNTNTNPGGNTNTGGDNGTGGGNTNTNPGGNTNTGGENGSGDTNTTNEIEVPDASVDGIIEVSNTTWSNGTASITISKGSGVDSSLKMQYKKSTESDDKYVTVNGNSETISGLNDGEVVIVRLTDGHDKYGGVKTINIEDGVKPNVTVTLKTQTENSISVTVSATDGESGMPATPTYKYYIKKSSEGNYNTLDGTSGDTTHTFNNLETDEIYDIKVEVADNAGNTGVGYLEKVSTLVAIPDANDDGVLSIQGPTWNNGTASLTVKKGESVSASLDIEYKKEGEETYTRLESDTINNIANGEKIYIHLTDGTRVGTDKEIEVSDTTDPTAEIELSTTSVTTNKNFIATITLSDESGIDIANSRYVFNTNRGNIGEESESYTGAFTQNPQDIILNAPTAGTYYLHVLAVDKAGNKKEIIGGQRVTVTEPTGEEPPEPEEEVLLQFGEVQWNEDNSIASVTINKTKPNTFDIQYKIAGLDQEYTIVDGGTIENLYDGDVVTAWLFDGTTKAYEITLNIKAPDVTVPTADIKFSLKGMEPGESMTATVTQTDDDTGVNLAQSKYVFNTTSTKIGTDESLYTGGNFTKTPENIIINATDEGVYYLHVLTVDNSGNKEETISEPMPVIDLPGRAADLVPVEGNSKDGIIARDEDYNEWVWIEVPKEAFTTAKNDTDYNAIYNDLKTYTQSYSNSSYTDTFISGNGNFADQAAYNRAKQKMVRSIYDNGGFWISRYEIGTDNAAEAVAANTATVTKAESKPNLYPIVNKTQSQAQQIVKTIDSDASLMFGVQWDLVLKFLETKGMQPTDLTTNSASWGNYRDATFTPERGKYNKIFGTAENWLDATGVQHSNIAWCITTGAAEYTNKMRIYDLAGNVGEWTLESNGSSVVSRGGTGGETGTTSAGSRSNSSISEYDEYTGIRAVMYEDTSNQASDGTIVGKIKFDNVTWNDDLSEATVTVSKADENEYTLQYMINNDENWMSFSSQDGGEIPGLKDKDIVTVCLTDGTNKGYYATLTVVTPVGTVGYIEQHVNEYYGKTVNYTPKNGANVKWKIFYAGKTPGTETSNIYLIADNYISKTYAPNGINNTAITANSTYKLSFNNVINDYKGSSDITNGRIKPWLSYLNKYPNSTNPNMKAVAYMLDTDVWSTFTDDDRKAEYAIGGPTLDLFCESYNQKYPNDKLSYSSMSSTGYNLYTSLENANDSLYVISSSSNAYGMWLAGPGGDAGSLMDVYYYGRVADDGLYDGDYYGFRPLVCLKSDVQLEKQSDGTYKIN